MNIKNYFFALYILYFFAKEIKCLHEMVLGPWVLICSFTPIFLEKIAGGHNLPTVFLCWFNKHQNQVPLTTWNSKKKRWFCVLVKNRKYLLFGQKALDSTMFSVA